MKLLNQPLIHLLLLVLDLYSLKCFLWLHLDLSCMFHLYIHNQVLNLKYHKQLLLLTLQYQVFQCLLKYDKLLKYGSNYAIFHSHQIEMIHLFGIGHLKCIDLYKLKKLWQNNFLIQYQSYNH